MFTAELPSERDARINLQSARNRETERQKRIFNDKMRTMGVDQEGLDTQMKEKEKREKAAKEEQRAHGEFSETLFYCDPGDAEMLYNNKAAQLFHIREVKHRRAIDKADVEYRDQHQQPPCPREFDLKNPFRCGKTDFLSLVGEDLHSERRRRRQKEQLREWLLQQQHERAAERQQRKLEEQRYDQSNADMHNKALQLQGIEMEQRKAAAIATKEYNPARLTEPEPEPTPSMLGVHGSRPSSDRKTPPESLQQIIQFQKYQIEEKKRAELERKRDEEQYDRIRLDSNRTALLIERQQARVNKQLRRQMDNTNVQIAETNKQEPDRRCSDNGFFSKFNTCSR